MITSERDRTTRSPTARSVGVTLLEISAVVTISAFLFLAIWGAVGSAMNEVQSNASEAHMDAMLRKCASRITDEIADSGTDSDGVEHMISHPGPSAATASSITFRKCIDVTGDPATDWSTDITYSLQNSPGEIDANGVDDDGNGVTDERQLVRTQDGRTAVIAHGITSFSVTRDIGESLITLQITMARQSRGGRLVTRVLKTAVALRNVP